MDWESPNFIQCQIILLCSSQPKKFCQPNTHCVSHTTQPTLDYYRFTALPIGSKLCISKYFHHLDLPWWLWPILSEAAVWPPRARVVGEPPILGQAAVRPLAPRQAAVPTSVPGVQHHGHGPELLKKSSTRHCMLRNAEGCGTWEEERLRCCFQSIRQSWNIVMIYWLHCHNSCISNRLALSVFCLDPWTAPNSLRRVESMIPKLLKLLKDQPLSIGPRCYNATLQLCKKQINVLQTFCSKVVRTLDI